MRDSTVETDYLSHARHYCAGLRKGTATMRPLPTRSWYVFSCSVALCACGSPSTPAGGTLDADETSSPQDDGLGVVDAFDDTANDSTSLDSGGDADGRDADSVDASDATNADTVDADDATNADSVAANDATNPDAPDGDVAPSDGAGDVDTADSTATADTGDASAEAGDAATLTTDPDPCRTGPHPGALLDLGHGTSILALTATDSRLLSQDRDAHWVLWDTTAGTLVSSGDLASGSPPPGSNTPTYGASAIAGAILIAEPTFGTVEVRSATTGALAATIAGGSRTYGLASDGSYVFGASSTSLAAWSTTNGALLFDHAGDYHAARIFAAPTTLEIAAGPAGASVIENITTAGLASTSPPFNGTFNAWFYGGASFLTNTASTVWVYPAASGTPKGIYSLSSIDTRTLGGTGSWFWALSTTWPYSLNVYAAPGSGAPVATFPGSSASFSLDRIAVANGTATDVISLSGSVPTKIASFPTGGIFAAAPGASWYIGTASGLVYDMTSPSSPQPYGCGIAESIAGTADGSLAIATPRGIIIATSAGGGAIVGRLPLVTTGVMLSADGALLATGPTSRSAGAPYSPEPTVRVLSMPGGATLHEWTGASDFLLARGGTRIGVTLSTSGGIYDVAGALVTTATGMPRAISSDGRMAASGTTPVNIYDSGTLVGATNYGIPLAWMDNSNLLVWEYMFVTGGQSFKDVAVYAPSGTLLQTTALPNPLWILHTDDVIPMSTSTVYLQLQNAIFDITTGAKLWSSAYPNAVKGTVAGAFVVSRDRNRIVAEAY